MESLVLFATVGIAPKYALVDEGKDIASAVSVSTSLVRPLCFVEAHQVFPPVHQANSVNGL
jgi:hypothetical protein